MREGDSKSGMVVPDPCQASSLLPTSHQELFYHYWGKSDHHFGFKVTLGKLRLHD